MDARQNCRAGAPTRAIHALLSPFFSLLPTFEAHCKVSTHYFLLSSLFSLLYQTVLYYVICYKKAWLREKPIADNE